MEKSSTPTVAIAMSGGVDSSVAAALLKQAGYTVIGLHLSFWKDPTVFSDDELRTLPQNRCCSIASLEDARKIAAHLEIPFYVLNFREKFKEKIVDYYVAGYERGETPNPCVQCNREMKFGALLQRAQELGCQYLATGHYARIVYTDGLYKLYRAKDPLKDQSYFLYHLDQEKLSKILFPLGEYEKSAVYEIANNLKLPIPEKKESQGICFIPDKKNTNFLKRHVQDTARTPGPIRHVSGKIYAEQHQGLAFYTIGQREGIAIGGVSEPLYVAGFDTTNNTLIVGHDSDVFSTTVEVSQIQLTDEKIASGSNNSEIPIQAMIRYRFSPKPATVSFKTDSGKIKANVTFSNPVRAITKGQSIVFFQGDQVLGGGVID